MRLHHSHILLLVLSYVFATGCMKTDNLDLVHAEQVSTPTIQAAEDFLFNSTEGLDFTLEFTDDQANPVSMVPAKLYNGHPDENGQIIGKSFSDSEGEMHFKLDLPSAVDTLYVKLNYIGFPNLLKVASSDLFDARLNLGHDMDARLIGTTESVQSTSGANKRYAASSSSRHTFYYMGNFNDLGVPRYLMEERYDISNDLLSRVNAALPDGRPVPEYNPQYISSGTEADLKLTDSAEVLITFLHEGAGYRNAVGYYTYDLSSPPQSSSDIDRLMLIFPNVSYRNSGGNLRRGDRVSLGHFPANTGIGFFLVPDGWDWWSETVVSRSYQNVKFSNAHLNTFAEGENRRHTVLLNDWENEALILAFEDIDRPGGDKDFNDAIFLVHSSSFRAIETGNLALIQGSPTDSDGDGAPDSEDEFPNDPQLAYTVQYPAEGTYGVLFFEDLWPVIGDFDRNDMVINYQYTYELDANNQLRNIDASFKLKAMGAGYSNGFGIQLDLPASGVASVTGSRLFEDIVKLESNGVEANQRKAVIIAFDNGYRVMSRSNGEFVNVERGATPVEPVEIPMRITLSNPVDPVSIGSSPLNPFIFTALRRSYEIHLPDHAPTDLVDTSLFKTEDDNSNPNAGKYYRSTRNATWVLHVPYDIPHMYEKELFLKGYTRVNDWAKSGGRIYTDWYSNPEYRDYKYLVP